MMQRLPITPEGYKKLRGELVCLKETGRPEIAQVIAEARKHGDLSENAEYHAAKERQRNMEDRIAHLEKRLAAAQIIESKDPGEGRIVFGAYVTVIALSEGKQSFRIVGEDESDLKSGFLSSASPLARALLGKCQGDVIEIRAPGGIREYEIEQVSYKLKEK